MTKLQKIISKLPSKSGVYLMKNSKGKIIYVGKSVNLKSRVSSYFAQSSELNFAKQNMVKQVKTIDYAQTQNELEALVLETNFIKKEKPKYNILMKDDKNLSYIKITNDIIPEVYKTRIKYKDGQYFGPYPNTINVSLILSTLKKIFQIRSCKVKFAEKDGKMKILSKGGKNIPCLDYYIGLCSAPCILEKNRLEEYKKNIESLKDFLKGNTGKILKQLEEKMKEKAKNLEFEEADKIKNQIKNIEELTQKQIARDIIPGDNDVLVYLEKYEKIFIAFTEIRAGEIIGINNYEIENKLGESKAEILKFFLEQRYVESKKVASQQSKESQRSQNLPNKITLITNEDIKDKELLKFLKSQNILIENPKVGPKVDVINFTKNNLLNYAYKLELNNISKKTFTKNTMISILKKLGYFTEKKKEIIFECFDISHTGGNFTVASKSVVIDGKSINSKYKKYKINTVSIGEIDDFKSIKEVIYRRSLEAIEKGNFPDLFIIDGGKGQLSAALEGIKVGANKESHPATSGTKVKGQKLGVNICAIAKRDEEIFVPNKSAPILFEKGSPELMLLQKIRDEAHRFAISFHISTRTKAMKRNVLEELPGFGSITRKRLLKLAGNIDNIKNISREELESILSKKQIEVLEDYGLY